MSIPELAVVATPRGPTSTTLPALGDGAASTALLLHNWLLPALFYAAIALHAGAVLKHHFGDGRKYAVRRMLR